jgi:hypothetical protein
LDASQLRAFAVTVAAPAQRLDAPASTPITLPYNLDVVSSAPGKADGDFTGTGEAIAGDQFPATITCNGINFKFGPNTSGEKNAVASRGQVLDLPAGDHRKLYLLAASSNGDVQSEFLIGDQKITRTIQAWDGTIGSWDTRLWKGKVPELAFVWKNALAGLVPGFIKPDVVAWYADHKRLQDGSDDPYAFTYLFRYEFDLPDSAQTIRLPQDDRIKIMAATVSHDPNADSTPARSLYDPQAHKASEAVTIVPAGGKFDHIQSVAMIPPLYNSGDLRYTTDGTDPNSSSPEFKGRLNLGVSTTLKVTSLSKAGQPGDITAAQFEIANKTPPQIDSVRLERAELHVLFNEPINPKTAEKTANYALTPPVEIKSAKLADSGDEVVLELGGILDESVQYNLTATGLRDLSGNAAAAGMTRALESIAPVVQIPESHDFDGKGDGIEKGEELMGDSASTVPRLPIKADASWTINVFARVNEIPPDHTTLAGFGNDSGAIPHTQRFIVKMHDSIAFWGNNVDVGSGVAFDVGKWQMITETFDGDTVRIYKNAKLIKSDSISLNDAAPITRLAPPGPWAEAHRFVGKLAGFAIWNRELDSQSIQRLMMKMPAN